MPEALRELLLRGLRLPPEPQPPSGAAGSLRQFRAARNYYRLRMLAWAFKQVSALVGIALAEGRIGSIDDPVTVYLPGLFKSDPRFARVTVRHLLQMRSGIAFDEGYRSPFADASRFYLTQRLPERVAGLAIARDPGQAYSYQSGDTQLLGMVVERAVGDRHTVRWGRAHHHGYDRFQGG